MKVMKTITTLLIVFLTISLIAVSAAPLISGQEIPEAQIPNLSIEIVERESINVTTGEPETMTPLMQITGLTDYRVGPGTYRKVDIKIKNIDAELPMPEGRLFGAILNTEKVGSTVWDSYKFWTWTVGRRLGVAEYALLTLAGARLLPSIGREMKVSTSVPAANAFDDTSWVDFKGDFGMKTASFRPGETITKTIYVLAHKDAVVGEKYAFRVALVTGSFFSGGTVVAIQDHQFVLDYPKIDIWLVVGAVLILSVLAAKWWKKI